MNITQSDRDALRASQHKLNANIIGNIIEHQIQDPKKYKQSSRQINRNQVDEQPQASLPKNKMPKVHYESKYLDKNDGDTTKKQVSEDNLPRDIVDLQAGSWLNMDQVEFDKLEWMTSRADKMHQEKLETTTQFDKEGRAVSITTLHAKNGSKLRGDETHDIQSLFGLLESAYDPQVTYSLNVITRIASFATMGYYDGAFDENIHDILLKGCLLRVRHHLDSLNETICLSALKCLRALLCNTQVDEVILDRIHPIISEHVDTNLWLHTMEMDSQDFNYEMKDSECIEVDTILGLICRTDILRRFSYLLFNKTGDISFAYCDSILDILIRMSRNSTSVCYMLSRKDIVPLIIDSLTPLDIISEGKQVRQLSIKVLKLMRIIAQAAFDLRTSVQTRPNELAIDLKVFNKLIPKIVAYFNIDIDIDCRSLQHEDAIQILKLYLETLRIMKALCRLGEHRSSIIDMIAMAHRKLLGELRNISRNLDAKESVGTKISIRWQYAAHLFDLIGCIMYQERYQKIESESCTDIYWSSFIKPTLFQWITDIIRLKCIPHLDISIAIAAVVYQYNLRADDDAVKSLHHIMIEPIIKDHNESKCINLFKLLAQTSAERSQLHNFTKISGRIRDPKGLPSYGCLNYNLSAQYNFKLSPLFENDSPFIMLNTFINQLVGKREEVWGREEVDVDMKFFIEDPNINRYLKSVASYHKYPIDYESMVQQSMVAQYEVRMICLSLLTINRFYLVHDNADANLGEVEKIKLAHFLEKRIECYSSLIDYTICVIGLINLNSVEMLDKLIAKVLLNAELHRQVLKESYPQESKIENSAFSKNINYCLNGEEIAQLSSDHLNVLIPLYLSCDQSNRYWIFQPIIEYYYGRIKQSKVGEQKDEQSKVIENHAKDHWFRSNVPWRLHTGQQAAADDGTIVDTILSFNYFLMIHSSHYLQSIIKSNLEDHLCLIGILFLDDDLFLDPVVNEALTNNLRTILIECTRKESKHRALFEDASKVIKPLDLTLADFFNKLVDQFEAVSYGDLAFSNFLLLFITPGSDIVFRKRLFQEKSETCLSQLRISMDNIWSPCELYLSEKEKDTEMRLLLKRSSPFLSKSSFLEFYSRFHLSN